jgi:hypothetical protein
MPYFGPIGYGNPLPVGFGSASGDIWWQMTAVTLRAAIIARLITQNLTNLRTVSSHAWLCLHRMN